MTVEHDVHCERMAILEGAVVRHAEAKVTLAHDAMDRAVPSAALDLLPLRHTSVVVLAQA
jgi:hypothetical protein